MTAPLFRKEALEHRKDKLYGDVILLQPLSMTILVGVVVTICLLVLTILFWGTYARKETVHGFLLPDKGIVKTYAPQAGGTIYEIHVREGDAIKEGQALITILSERSMQGGSDIDTLKLHELDITLQHQQERIKGEETLLVAQTHQLQTQIKGLKKELEQIEQSLKNQQDRVKSFESRVQAFQKLLETKNVSQSDYQKIYEDFLAQKQQYQELIRTKVNRQNSLAQAESELEQLPLKSKSHINEIEKVISELRQQTAEVQGRRQLEIRAPIAGTVTALQAREGQMATNNTPLMAIIPKDAIMQAELYVPSRAIGFITPGQTVRIRYDAFPYRRFGIYEGTVEVISKHALLPSELTIPMELKEPVYRVTVNLKQQHVMAYGKDFPLQAGMSLEADIILEKQTLFRWILDPLISLKGRF